MKPNTYIFTFSNGDEYQHTGSYTACRITALSEHMSFHGDASGYLDIVGVIQKTKSGWISIANRKV